MVDDDVLGRHAAAVVFPDEIAGEKQVEEFGGQACRSGTGDERLDAAGAVAGFLQQLAGGGAGEGLSEVLDFITDDACRNFDHAALDRDSELFDKHDFLIGRDREDADAMIRVRTTHEVPVADALEFDPTGFEKCLQIGHGVNWFQETLARGRKAGYSPAAAQMSRHDFQIPITFKHRVVFTRDAFFTENSLLAEILAEGGGRRALVVVEAAVANAWPLLAAQIKDYFDELEQDLRGVRILPGGEAVKADDSLVREIWSMIDAVHLDRHSYLLAIGGGAFLDAVGYAAATAHRGVRLVRFPTTTLSQDDSGVGVKCAFNAFGRKNWIGAFSVPYAVINDFRFLESQDDETCRAGLIEAVKVALVKDREFFEWIEANLAPLAALEPSVLEACVEKSALLHARHIAGGGDPFETGSSRPLDFGHWAAHKLESLTSHKLPHGPAVAIGVALDTLYSVRAGLAPGEVGERVLRVLSGLRLAVHHPALDLLDESGRRRVFEGLDEFREHLGGGLTVLMLRKIGEGVDVHGIEHEIMCACIDELRHHME